MLFDSLELSRVDSFKDEIAKLRRIANERNLEDIKMSHRLMDGDLVNNMKIAVKEDEIDFVVMGTSGANGWTAIFIGTNTGEVLTSIEVPLLAVPSTSNFNAIETIGFTTRYRNKDKEALRQVLKIAKKLSANVKCLYVKNNDSDVTEITINTWEKEFNDENLQFFVIPNEEVEQTIFDFIDNQNIDILAMTTYKRNFFVELFTTHFSERVSYKSSIPILMH